MRIFHRPSPSFLCPICKTSEDKEVTLIPIYGTNTEGSMSYEARQYHVECIDLMETKNKDGTERCLLQRYKA